MIQVGQWYGSHVVSFILHCLRRSAINFSQTEIPRKRIRKPTVSFIDVNREFANRSPSRSLDSGNIQVDMIDHDDDSDSDTDEADTEDNLIQPILDGLEALDIDTDSDININSEFLSQFLTEGGSPTQNSQTTAIAATGDENPSNEGANWDSD